MNDLSDCIKGCKENKFRVDEKTYIQTGGKISYSNQAGTLTEYEIQEGGTKVKINGKEIVDGSIVYIGKNGVMNVVDVNDLQENSLVYVNGILADAKYAHDQAKSLSLLSGRDVYMLFNSTNGFRNDIVDAYHTFNPLSPKTLQAEASTGKLISMIKTGKVGTIIGHSEGGIIANTAYKKALALKNSKDRDKMGEVQIATFGSPNYYGVSKMPIAQKIPLKISKPANTTPYSNPSDIMHYNPINSPVVPGTGFGHDVENYMYDMVNYLNKGKNSK